MDVIDPTYPIFVLVFCVFRKEDYVTVVEPAVRRLKLEFLGHDGAILHEREIRKQMPPFEFLRRGAEIREAFYQRLRDLIA